MVTFEKAFQRLIGHEGGYTNDRNDAGNWTGGQVGRGELRGTKYGISAAAYPHLDIANLTLGQAQEIYKTDYWQLIGGDNTALKFQLFDAAVNHGRGNAIRMLQRTVGVAEDGVWGPVSQSALNAMDMDDQLLRFISCRLSFWAALKAFDTYGRGWTRRAAENLMFAAGDN